MSNIQSLISNSYIQKASSGQNVPDTTNSANNASNPADSARNQFLSYMQKTPAQRMEEDWLKKHGLTKEKLDAMSPQERKAVMEQMRREIEEQMKKSSKNSTQNMTDILV